MSTLTAITAFFVRLKVTQRNRRRRRQGAIRSLPFKFFVPSGSYFDTLGAEGTLTCYTVQHEAPYVFFNTNKRLGIGPGNRSCGRFLKEKQLHKTIAVGVKLDQICMRFSCRFLRRGLVWKCSITARYSRRDR